MDQSSVLFIFKSIHIYIKSKINILNTNKLTTNFKTHAKINHGFYSAVSLL